MKQNTTSTIEHHLFHDRKQSIFIITDFLPPDPFTHKSTSARSLDEKIYLLRTECWGRWILIEGTPNQLGAKYLVKLTKEDSLIEWLRWAGFPPNYKPQPYINNHRYCAWEDLQMVKVSNESLTEQQVYDWVGDKYISNWLATRVYYETSYDGLSAESSAQDLRLNIIAAVVEVYNIDRIEKEPLMSENVNRTYQYFLILTSPVIPKLPIALTLPPEDQPTMIGHWMLVGDKLYLLKFPTKKHLEALLSALDLSLEDLTPYHNPSPFRSDEPATTLGLPGNPAFTPEELISWLGLDDKLDKYFLGQTMSRIFMLGATIFVLDQPFSDDGQPPLSKTAAPPGKQPAKTPLPKSPTRARAAPAAVAKKPSKKKQ